jgi:methionyl-tRNA synthetase
VLRKTDPERMGTVLYVTAEVMRAIGIMTQPFVPGAASKLLDLLSVSADDRSFAAIGPDERLEPGATVPQPEPIFPRYVDSEAE